MKIAVLSLVAFLAFWVAGQSQSLDGVIKAGNESFETKDYYNAFRCYERVLDYVAEGKYKGNWDPLYIKYRYAESAQRFNYNEKANTIYTELLEESKGNNMDVYARSTFNLARVKQSLAEPVFALNVMRLDTTALLEAGELYQRFLDSSLHQYLKIFPKDPKDTPIALGEEARQGFIDEANKGASDCREALLAARTHPEAALEKDTIMRLSGKVNSEYSDLAPVLRGNTLYFSSVKFPSNPDRLNRQSRIYSEVLRAKVSTNAAGALDSILAVDTLEQAGFFNDANDFSHTIHTAITHNGEWMYFSHCPQGRGEDPHCTLYRRKKTGGGWGEPEYVSINVDSTRFTTTQPSISYDPLTGEQWMYFTSDREGPGTKGKLDIWRCKVNEEDGSLSGLQPVTEANSEWNDATPFLHVLSNRLFFSSDREPSFGLYDNFVMDLSAPEQPILNLGLPYNSGYNDQYYFLNEDGGLAFFSSDRPESTRFIDSLDACCQDIYTYPVDISVEMDVRVYGCGDDITGETETSLKIYDITYCDCEEDNLVPVEGLKKYHKYRLVASHPDFVTNRDVVVHFDGSYGGELDTSIVLSPAFVDLTFVVRDSVTKEPLELEEYSLNVTSEGGAPSEKLGPQTYRLNPMYDYTLTVKAKNPVYNPKTITLGRNRLTSGCTKTEYVDLTIPCTPDYLQNIIFYFDNDKPDRIVRSRWTTTNDRYDYSLIEPYIAQKEAYREFNLRPYTVAWSKVSDRVRFESNDSGGIDTLLNIGNASGNPQSQTAALRYMVEKVSGSQVRIIPDPTIGDLVGGFFGGDAIVLPDGSTAIDSGDIKNNLQRFDSLANYLANYLRTGQDITITMRAYCSKRVSGIYNTYNDSLAVRRIRCIRQTLDDILEEELEGVSQADRGTLTIVSEPLSDSEATTNFPDPDLNYNTGVGGKLFFSAALDRRVEITGIKHTNCEGGTNGPSTQTNAKNPGQP
ncbi:MAG: PD40 domain-containing protein [Phaeodactylibacter sp.]|nr:PD40 domain-containing protein [Phaeodactylibacter sp.]MCB9285969.1 PD40 domain-containing protein [Lewinellaceae bacterium]